MRKENDEMIKHIVIWKLKDQEQALEMKKRLEALPHKIKEIQSLEVGINILPVNDYDIALTVTFNNLDDLNTYQNHPDHLQVFAFVKQVAEKRVAVDYEF